MDEEFDFIPEEAPEAVVIDEEYEENLETDMEMPTAAPPPQSAKYHYIYDNDRFSSDQITPFEQARLISVRTQQIARSSHILFVKARPGDTHQDIAKRELEEGRLPLLLYRVVHTDSVTGDKTVEVWDPKEMSF